MEPTVGTCNKCYKTCHYIDCPTGGWWAHDIHPADDHDADPGWEPESDMTNDGYWFIPPRGTVWSGSFQPLFDPEIH